MLLSAVLLTAATASAAVSAAPPPPPSPPCKIVLTEALAAIFIQGARFGARGHGPDIALFKMQLGARTVEVAVGAASRRALWVSQGFRIHEACVSDDAIDSLLLTKETVHG